MRPAKAPNLMSWYQKLVHRPNYHGPHLPTPADGPLDNFTPPFFKWKKTSQKAGVESAFGSPTPRSPGTKVRPQFTESGQANAQAQKWVGHSCFTLVKRYMLTAPFAALAFDPVPPMVAFCSLQIAYPIINMAFFPGPRPQRTCFTMCDLLSTS